MKKPFDHQKKSLAHDKTTNVVFDCSDPGTGKTAVAVWSFETRRKKKGGCALVLAPRSLLRSAWANDFKRFAPSLVTSVATAADRAERFEAKADVYITNHDAVKWLVKQPAGFFKKFDSLYIDESPAYKHGSTQRSKALAKITKHFKYRRAMTGTPNGRSITDVWHQVFLLDDGARLGKSYFQFRNGVCQPTQVGFNANAIRWEDKEGAEEAVFGLLQDIVIRHKFEKCVDIPANHRYTMEYQLPKKQMTAYLEMEKTQMLLFKQKTLGNVTAKLLGTPAPDVGVISAVNAAVVMGKLSQIASGAIYSGGDEYHLVDDGRYKMVLDLVEARKHPIVFFLWRHQRDCLVAEAETRGMSFAVIDGGTSDKERDSIMMRYQIGQFDVVFGHPKSMAHGLTMTAGTSIIWASPTYDLEWFEQGSKRQHRIGQTEKTETITVIAEGTVDERIYHRILMPKQKRMANLLDLFEGAT